MLRLAEMILPVAAANVSQRVSDGLAHFFVYGGQLIPEEFRVPRKLV